MRNHKKTKTLILVLVALMVPLSALSDTPVPGLDYREGEILVKYRPYSAQWERGRVRGLVKALRGRAFRHLGMEKLTLGPGLTAAEAVEVLKDDPNIEYAELSYYVEFLDAPRTVPDDPGFTSGAQWYLDTSLFAGSHVGTDGTIFIDRDIDAPEAWAVMDAVFDSTTAASVGVLDSGCGEDGSFSPLTGYEPNHQDLPNSSLWRNPVEASGIFNVDDDSNALTDDVNGWDFQGNDNTMADIFDSAAPYHGTHISGIVAGQWGNGVGIAGIGREQLKVLPLRTSTSTDIAQAIDYAIETSGTPGVMVLNASWKFSFPPVGLDDVISDARDAGIAFVAAAGNDGNNNDISVGVNRVYPAQYTKVPLDNVLAVAATGLSGNLVSFSNYGPEYVQIAAPGVDIYSPREGFDGYSGVNGTSFSAPIAASALALVMAANPALSPAEAIDRVIDGGEFDARLAGLIKSGKRVNLAGALAPFAPYSGPAPMDTLVPISLYADSVSSLYGSITSAISESPSVAVMVTVSGGAWAVSPVSPGLTTFELEFDGIAAPVGTYETGLWRVTGISPFSAQVFAGQSFSFTSLMPSGGIIDWSVNNSTVGTINESGLFTALSDGITQVVLTIDGQDVDNSGTILVIGLDEDLDGYRAGPDCDDTNPDINPGERELCSDGIDNDCDGDVDGFDSECSSGGGSSGGGCGTALPPGDGEPMWPVLLVLGGMALLLLGRRLDFKIQNSNRWTNQLFRLNSLQFGIWNLESAFNHTKGTHFSHFARDPGLMDHLNDS